jgi:hypothetical protein
MRANLLCLSEAAYGKGVLVAGKFGLFLGADGV